MELFLISGAIAAIVLVIYYLRKLHQRSIAHDVLISVLAQHQKDDRAAVDKLAAGIHEFVSYVKRLPK